MIVIITFTQTSCKKPCKDVICQNGGAAVEDGKNCNCECKDGFSGEFCETWWLSAFMGTYDVIYNCTGDGQSGSGNYFSTLVEVGSNAPAEFRFSNFSNYNSGAIGTLSNPTTFTIRENNVDPNFFGMKFSGSGTVSGNKIEITYTVTYNGTKDECTATYTKQ